MGICEAHHTGPLPGSRQPLLAPGATHGRFAFLRHLNSVLSKVSTLGVPSAWGAHLLTFTGLCAHQLESHLLSDAFLDRPTHSEPSLSPCLGADCHVFFFAPLSVGSLCPLPACTPHEGRSLSSRPQAELPEQCLSPQGCSSNIF